MLTFEPPVESPFVPLTAGDRIQHARRLMGVFLGWDVTQSHLANFLGVPLTTVAGLEGDSVEPGLFLEALSAALGVRQEYILFGSPPMGERISDTSRTRWTFVLHGMQPNPVVRALDS